ncbi:MAG: cobalamin biosynthesis protein, partial [Pseudomonadota bacterium]
MLYSSFDSAWALLLATLLGVALDWWLGEPRRWHPLVGFGRFVSAVEARLNRAGRGTIVQRTFGLLALLLVVLPIVLVADSLFDILKQWSTYLYVLVSAGLLYLAIG